nr:hypothetical protein [Actinomadura sp. BRA 177]
MIPAIARTSRLKCGWSAYPQATASWKVPGGVVPSTRTARWNRVIRATVFGLSPISRRKPVSRRRRPTPSSAASSRMVIRPASWSRHQPYVAGTSGSCGHSHAVSR